MLWPGTAGYLSSSACALQTAVVLLPMWPCQIATLLASAAAGLRPAAQALRHLPLIPDRPTAEAEARTSLDGWWWLAVAAAALRSHLLHRLEPCGVHHQQRLGFESGTGRNGGIKEEDEGWWRDSVERHTGTRGRRCSHSYAPVPGTGSVRRLEGFWLNALDDFRLGQKF